MSTEAQAFPQIAGGIISLKKWLELVGIEATTAWRWRKAGWLETENIAGRPYVTSEGVARFKTRVAAGEFAKEHPSPRRNQSTLP